MGGRLSLERPRVYGVAYSQLGDHWVALCHLVRFRRLSRLPHRLGIVSTSKMGAEQRVLLLKQIAKILNVESELEFADEPPELVLPVHPARNGVTLEFPGALRARRDFIAFQFDGDSMSDFNPTTEELESFLACFESGLLRRVGRPLTLEESIQILANSKLFVGVSSGMSHLAASANTPSLIFSRGGAATDRSKLSIVDKYGDLWRSLDIYKRLRRWHPYRNTRFFSNLDELRRALRMVSRPAPGVGRPANLECVGGQKNRRFPTGVPRS
jgi:hypothetical protein